MTIKTINVPVKTVIYIERMYEIHIDCGEGMSLRVTSIEDYWMAKQWCLTNGIPLEEMEVV